MTEQILVEELHNLEIFFCKIQPEMLLDGGRFHNRVGYNTIDAPTYLACFDAITFNLTRDEIKNRYAHVINTLADNNGVWGLLSICGKEMLNKEKGEPRCRIDNIIAFSEIGQAISQDHVVLAWLASENCKDGRDLLKSSSFTWPAILRSDDKRLNTIIEKGLAENHYHLNGSTQNFALTWAALMNKPGKIAALMNNKVFKELLLEKNIPLEGTEVLGQVALLKQAALIRALLFSYAVGDCPVEDINTLWNRYSTLPFSHNIDRLVSYLRWNYGEKVMQRKGTQKCLDYALSGKLFNANMASNVRLLSGERALLYACFYRCFRNEFDEEINNLLYYYLIIKIQFRRLFIQVNKVKGFDNFSVYQDRKDVIYRGFYEYLEEALRMSLKSPIEDNHVSSLEARIMPKESADVLAGGIKERDNAVIGNLRSLDDAQKAQRKAIVNKYYYVLHFAKRQLRVNKKKRLNNYIRNAKTRKSAEKSARSIVYLLREKPDYAKRIYGIDACSHEIGCRPETFATEYRYLRKESPIGFSYHVGEDYLDICDGLRAIDEAIQFLELGGGDRLGHALALGVNADDYYAKKRYVVYMPKQDVLDNYVWLKERSIELGVSIPYEKMDKMKTTINKLMKEIYEKDPPYSIDEYYDSWKLRGDHPSQYSSGKYERDRRCYIDYNRYKSLNDESLETIRTRKNVADLYYRYHYDVNAIVAGNTVIGINIEKWYVKAMTDMQNALMKKVSEKNIIVECNPTSNKLIGPFDHYEDHPMLRFNNAGFDMGKASSDIMVTINTDDLGVFDTSLENEYAVMFRAMVHLFEGNEKITKEEIYQYIERIRQMGFISAFKKREEQNEFVTD